MKKNLALFVIGIALGLSSIFVENISILSRAALALTGVALIAFSLRCKMKRMTKKEDFASFGA